MHALALLLSCWAYASHGRRVNTDLRTLSAVNPAAAWQGVGLKGKFAESKFNCEHRRWHSALLADDNLAVREPSADGVSSIGQPPCTEPKVHAHEVRIQRRDTLQKPRKKLRLRKLFRLCKSTNNDAEEKEEKQKEQDDRQKRAAANDRRRSIWSFLSEVCRRVLRPSTTTHASADVAASIHQTLASATARNIASHGQASTTMISFYKFAHVSEPASVATEFKSTIQSLDPSIKGTLYIAQEGINGAFMVPTRKLQDFHAALASVEGMRGNLTDLDFNIGECISADDVASNPPFRKLLIKSRPQILTDGLAELAESSSGLAESSSGTSQVSLNWSDAGPEVTPEQWHQEVERDVAADQAILIDCRNRVETEVGTFKGAKALNTQQFSDSWEKLDEMLNDKKKDTRILTFCTGGIRCVKVNAYLKNKGFKNIGRLQKGIIGYEKWLEENASNLPSTFEGENFLFDRRRMRLAKMDATTLIKLEAPPVLNSPVYSLATLCEDGQTNMNILTYATPVGVAPRLWAVSLFRKTLSHANFKRERTAVLQLLCGHHASLVHTLGGQSGRDIDKARKCAEAGFSWLEMPSQGRESLLPGCVAYLRLHQVGDFVDAGEHDLALCRVEAFADPEGPPPDTALSSAALRAAGLITDKGRAVEPTA